MFSICRDKTTNLNLLSFSELIGYWPLLFSIQNNKNLYLANSTFSANKYILQVKHKNYLWLKVKEMGPMPLYQMELQNFTFEMDFNILILIINIHRYCKFSYLINFDF